MDKIYENGFKLFIKCIPVCQGAFCWNWILTKLYIYVYVFVYIYI